LHKAEFRIQLEPDEIGFKYNKALLLRELGNYSGAAAVLSGTVEQHPECAACWNSLGMVLAEQDLYSEAIEAYDRAIEQNSSYVEPWNNRGIAMVMLNESYVEALRSFDRAIEIDPDCLEAWVNRANALKLAGRGPEAEEAQQRARKLGYQGTFI